MDIDPDTELARTHCRRLHEVRSHRRTRPPTAGRKHQIRARDGESLFNAARRHAGMWRVEGQGTGSGLRRALHVDSLLARDLMRRADAAEGVGGCVQHGFVAGRAGDVGVGGAEGGGRTADPEESAVGVDGLQVDVFIAAVDGDHGEGARGLALEGGGGGEDREEGQKSGDGACGLHF